MVTPPFPAVSAIAVAPVLFPMVIVFALLPVPIFTFPVLPESIVIAFAPVADLIVNAPESEMLFAERVCVEPLIIKLLMVFVEVAAVIAPADVTEKFPPSAMLFEASTAIILTSPEFAAFLAVI